MVFRIFLFLALAVAIGSGVVNELKVNKLIVGLETDRDDTIDETNNENRLEQEAASKTSDTNQVIQATQQALDAAKSALQQKIQEVGQTRNALTQAQQAQRRAEQELARTRQSDENYKEFAMPIPEIKRLRDTLPKRQRELATTRKELEIVGKDNLRLKNQIRRLRPKDLPPPMPAGLAGQVIAHDPKYQFVVVNVGENHGAVVNGVMLIDREGQFLGKIKIMRVEPDHSVANIIQDWKVGEIQEGDRVIYKDL